jgi:cytochrome c553
MTALPAKDDAAPTGFSEDTALRPADSYRNSPPVDEFHYAAPSSGFADQTIHDFPARTCARCHGPDGSGAVTGGEAPNLTIQEPAYLQAALEAYTRGSRKSGYMQNIAAQLSEAEISALAHYYGSLPAQTPSSPPGAPELVNRGQAIATEGVPEIGAPACANCHESSGSKITGAPHLAGQSVIYLRRELTAMSRGGRGSTGWWNPMPSVAHALSDRDIAAVAAYYSGLKPAKGAAAAQATQPSSPAQTGSGDLAAAKAIFNTQCVKCHVNNGRGDPQGNYPDLTLLTTPFVAQNLYEFRSGARPSDKMRQVTGGLSLADINSLAHYINGLTPQPALAKPDAAAALRGAAIATRGDSARGIPACLSCHDANGVNALPLIPRLEGQNVFYLRKRLTVFAQPDARNLSTLNPMPQIASKLTDQERADLAAYFASAAPLQKPSSQP